MLRACCGFQIHCDMRDEMLDCNLPGTMPRRRRRHFHHCELPVELYSEIIGYLWNDIPSLKACSLANRIMTVQVSLLSPRLTVHVTVKKIQKIYTNQPN